MLKQAKWNKSNAVFLNWMNPIQWYVAFVRCYDIMEQKLKVMRFTWLPFHAAEQQISEPTRLLHLSTLTPATFCQMKIKWKFNCFIDIGIKKGKHRTESWTHHLEGSNSVQEKTIYTCLVVTRAPGMSNAQYRVVSVEVTVVKRCLSVRTPVRTPFHRVISSSAVSDRCS